MKYVQLGGRRVSAIGLGTWQFGSAEWGWGADFGPADARAVVERALEVGVSFFDTAEIYGRGRSEEILGAALREAGSEAMVASKVWPTRMTAQAVVDAAERSRDRLGRATIDLYQIHWPNPLAPLSWTMAGMRRLLSQGTIGAVGVSNFSLGQWRRSERVLGQAVVSNQVHYHLLRRSPEDVLLPYAAGLGRTIIAYSPLAQGFLAATHSGRSPRIPVREWNSLFDPRAIQKAEPLFQALRSVAAEHGATSAQVALAWTIRDGNVIAIPGARRPHQVEENTAAADIELTADQVDRLERAADSFRLPRRMQWTGLANAALRAVVYRASKVRRRA